MATVTDSEILSIPRSRPRRTDSPPASARAGARDPILPVTVRVSKIRTSVAHVGGRWWAWTARPMSLRATWRASAIDVKRVPAKSSGWTWAWRISNWSDRLVMFALTLAAPTFMQGPLRWLAARPTRRWAFYLTTAALTVALTLAGRRAGKE